MATPQLCVTVTAPTTAELREKRDAVADADLIELRLDTVSDPSVAGALAGRRRPVIVTCRPPGKAGASPARRKSAIGFWPMRSRWAPSTSTSNGARGSTICSRRWAPRRPLDARLRRDTRRPSQPGAGDALRGSRAGESQRHAEMPRRLRAAARAGRRGVAARRHGDDRHGRLRCGDARAARTIWLGVDVRGRVARRRASDGVRTPQGVPIPLDHRLHGRLRRRRRFDLAFRVSLDAQRGVRRGAARRGVSAASGGERRRFPGVRARASASAARA